MDSIVVDSPATRRASRARKARRKRRTTHRATARAWARDLAGTQAALAELVDAGVLADGPLVAAVQRERHEVEHRAPASVRSRRERTA